MTLSNAELSIPRLAADISVGDLENSLWNSDENLEISQYWNGSAADPGRRFLVSTLWSDRALYFRFNAAQNEALIAADELQTGGRTIGLWERDVCEVFIAPDKDEQRRYFEFEVAPTGEWLDLAIDSTSGERLTDWDYHSGMEAAARIEDDRVVMAMKIPWEAFGRKPEPGDIWPGNIFRCVGKDPGRGYLAWQPTLTEKPNFHVPEKFGEFRFVD